ncbi:MAG: hypothetical protein HY016_03925 [Nitrosomonadales bacterium]|nr:hypothetical protein [Nitrosomonadales bacterium]
MKLKQRINFGVVSLMLLTLTACLKDLGSNTPTESVIQGYYQGSTSKSKTSDLVILEDGSFWQIYGSMSGPAFNVQGVITGSTSAGNGNFSLTAKDFPAPGTSPVQANGGGTYTVTTLLGSITENGQTTTLSAVVPVSSSFNYNSAANLPSIVGSWPGTFLNGDIGRIDVATDGTFTVSSTSGCSATGLIKPRANGKNVFDISLILGASACASPNLAMSGIALTYPSSNFTNRLIVGLGTPSQSMALTFNAER